MGKEQEDFEKFPEVIKDSLKGRIFRYRNNSDLYRIEEVNILKEKDYRIVNLVAYNLTLQDRTKINLNELGGLELEFVDITSEQLSQALNDFFRPNRRKLESK